MADFTSGNLIAATGPNNTDTVTGAAATALLSAFVGDSGSGGTKGLVPAPASGDAAALKFLKADGTWAGSVTVQGNTFNGASQLVKLDANGNISAVGGNGGFAVYNPGTGSSYNFSIAAAGGQQGNENGGDLFIDCGVAAGAGSSGSVKINTQLLNGKIALGISTSLVGFYGQTPHVLQTGVGVNAAAIHAALVNLGLITA